MHEPNNKLQIERIVFFSDAVIAIAITLLIIEIKPPHLGGHAVADTYSVREPSSMIPKFIAFLISFFVIAVYWKAHHHLFGYLTTYTDSLIWLNTLFLLTIVIMPFSTAFYSENFSSNTAYGFYCFNIILTGLFNWMLVRYISSGKHRIASVAGNRPWAAYYSRRSLVAPLIFLVSLLVSFYSPSLSRACFILIFPVIWLLNRNYKTKLSK